MSDKYDIEWAKDPFYPMDRTDFINLTVKFAGFPDPMPFGATPNDPQAHGRELYENASAGVYGVVAPYVPPPAETITQGTVNTLFTQSVRYTSLEGQSSQMTDESATALSAYVKRLNEMLDEARVAYDAGVAYDPVIPDPPALYLKSPTGKPIPISM